MGATVSKTLARMTSKPRPEFHFWSQLPDELKLEILRHYHRPWDRTIDYENHAQLYELQFISSLPKNRELITMARSIFFGEQTFLLAVPNTPNAPYVIYPPHFFYPLAANMIHKLVIGLECDMGRKSETVILNPNNQLRWLLRPKRQPGSTPDQGMSVHGFQVVHSPNQVVYPLNHQHDTLWQTRFPNLSALKVVVGIDWEGGCIEGAQLRALQALIDQSEILVTARKVEVHVGIDPCRREWHRRPEINDLLAQFQEATEEEVREKLGRELHKGPDCNCEKAVENRIRDVMRKFGTEVEG